MTDTPHGARPADNSKPSQLAADNGGLGLRAETLAEGFAFLAVLTVAQRLIGLLREILFCRWLTPDELGQWVLSFGFFLLAAPIVVCGIAGCFGRYVEYYRQRGSLRSFLRRTTIVIGILAVTGISAILLGRRQVAWLIFGDTQRTDLVVLLACGLVALVVFNYLTELFAAMRLARLVYGLQLITSLMFAVIGLSLFAVWQVTAVAVIVAYSLACSVAALWGLYYLVRVWRGIPQGEGSPPSSSLWGRILPFAGWLWVTNLLVNLFERADCYMIMHFGGFGQQVANTLVGNYHCSRVIPLLMISVAGLLSGLILPHLSHNWERGQRGHVVNRLNLIFKLTAVAFMTGGVVLLAMSPLLFGWILGGKYNGGLAVLPWTLTYCVWFGLSLVAQNYLWCVERARLVSGCYLTGLALNVGLNLLLLPRLGLLGAVLATACGNAVCLGLVHVFNRRWGMKVPLSVVVMSVWPVTLGLGVWVAAAAWLVVVAVLVWTDFILTPDERQRIDETLRGYLAHLGRFSGREQAASA